MKTLSLAQVQRVNDAVHQLYADVVRGDFVSASIRAITRVVSGDNSLAAIMDQNSGSVTGRIEPEVPNPAELATTFARWQHQHPAIGFRAGQARSVGDFLSRREWHRRELYAEVYRPHGMEDDLGVEVEVASRVYLVVGRSRSRRNFSREDHLLVSLLAPHLRAAWQQSQATLRLPLPAAVEHELGCGLVELNASGRVLACGAAANALLRDYFGAVGTCLPGELLGWFRSQQTALLRGIFRVAGARGNLTIRYVKDPASGRSFLLFQEQRWAPEVAESARLGSLGLSRREQEVLFWVAQGKTNAATSRLLGISPGTVKRHLENIYLRLGVENRHGATLRALQCMG